MSKRIPNAEGEGQDNQALRPFFSIGVTTYNRPDLLRQTLASMTHQLFSDFEVIVGNDYAQEPLSADRLGIRDSRIRFVNHAQNLGEARNMNTLLDLARGRFFTWQCDDDLYAPNFLEDVHAALVKFNFPSCVFTSYEFIRGTSSPDASRASSAQAQVFSGRQFLTNYWSGKLKAMGCTAVYDKEYLKQMGGVECLSDSSHPLYSEHLLLVRAGLLKQVVHIDKPLIRYRLHEGAWGCKTNDLLLYRQASQQLISKSITVFRSPELIDDFRQNIASVLKFVITDFFSKARSCEGLLSRIEAVPFFFSLRPQFNSQKGSPLYRLALLSWLGMGMRLSWWMLTQFNLKAGMSPIVHRFTQTLRSLFRTRRQDSAL